MAAENLTPDVVLSPAAMGLIVRYFGSKEWEEMQLHSHVNVIST